MEGGVAVLDETLTLTSSVTEGIVLYGQNGLSLPQTEAVFEYGSPAVKEWLEDHHRAPTGAYRDITGEYEAECRKSSPLFNDTAYAQLGGWHMQWPEDEWENWSELQGQSLLIWTFKDAEPWVEVWQEGDIFRVEQRIS